MTNWITTPFDGRFDELCEKLSASAAAIDTEGTWPGEQLKLCADYGVYSWFLPEEQGGQGWSDADRLRGYMRLSAACLSTTFVITQATGAMRRIAAKGDTALCEEWIPEFLYGRRFTTLGISHLTTSRRHLDKPALRAAETPEGFVLDGYSPWVTGGAHADLVVTGAQLDDGRQILVALPTDLPGVSSQPHAQLVALTSSHTGAMQMDGVHVDPRWLLAGPETDVMQTATGAQTGGLQTSALALGLADAALDYLTTEAEKRDDLVEPAATLRDEHAERVADLIAMAEGNDVCTSESLRAGANSLALRATQATLAAAKGAGFVEGHPVGRWCREAMFFLVWSCPQPVMAANLCELAGLAE